MPIKTEHRTRAHKQGYSGGLQRYKIINTPTKRAPQTMLRKCSAVGCARDATHRCAGCGGVEYCGQQCQLTSHRRHRRYCAGIRALVQHVPIGEHGMIARGVRAWMASGGRSEEGSDSEDNDRDWTGSRRKLFSDGAPAEPGAGAAAAGTPPSANQLATITKAKSYDARNTPDNLLGLPPELLVMIASWLSIATVRELKMASRYLSSLLNDEVLYRQIQRRNPPLGIQGYPHDVASPPSSAVVSAEVSDEDSTSPAARETYRAYMIRVGTNYANMSYFKQGDGRTSLSEWPTWAIFTCVHVLHAQANRSATRFAQPLYSAEFLARLEILRTQLIGSHDEDERGKAGSAWLRFIFRSTVSRYALTPTDGGMGLRTRATQAMEKDGFAVIMIERQNSMFVAVGDIQRRQTIPNEVVFFFCEGYDTVQRYQNQRHSRDIDQEAVFRSPTTRKMRLDLSYLRPTAFPAFTTFVPTLRALAIDITAMEGGIPDWAWKSLSHINSLVVFGEPSKHHQLSPLVRHMINLTVLGFPQDVNTKLPIASLSRRLLPMLRTLHTPSIRAGVRGTVVDLEWLPRPFSFDAVNQQIYNTVEEFLAHAEEETGDDDTFAGKDAPSEGAARRK